MVKVTKFFAMTLGAFVFWQSMDKVHVWIALHQDEKIPVSLDHILCGVYEQPDWYHGAVLCIFIKKKLNMLKEKERMEKEEEIRRVREELLLQQAKERDSLA